ncbi:MAG TPA: translation elongation factor Ts [Chlamydiales bacterium]|nr:translation elongation factor Ts [Chlamydiales bacterium]
MSNITAEMIKDLRVRTGVGMSKCKEALVKADGDAEKAIEILRKEGMASAVKKEGRETKEGFVGYTETADAIIMVEVNAETDFVANHDNFKKFIEDLVTHAAKTRPASLEEFLKATCTREDKEITIDEYRNLLVQKFGENIQVRRIEVICKAEDASYGVYSHMNGKIVTVVEISGSKDAVDIAKSVAMHVAADSPEYLASEDIPANVKAKEEEIARSQIKGKPDFVVEKIVEGKLRAFAEQECLREQKFVKDPSVSVSQYVKNAGKEKGADLTISHFWRWKVGQ